MNEEINEILSSGGGKRKKPDGVVDSFIGIWMVLFLKLFNVKLYVNGSYFSPINEENETVNNK